MVTRARLTDEQCGRIEAHYGVPPKGDEITLPRHMLREMLRAAYKAGRTVDVMTLGYKEHKHG